MKSKYKRIGIDGTPEHRLIMEEHIGRKLDSNEHIHHINRNTRDNRIENLQIVTPQEHAKIHCQIYPDKKICVVCGKEFTPHKTKRARNKVCSMECKVKLDKIHAAQRKIPIDQFTRDGEFIKQWDSARDVQDTLNYAGSNICKCCHNKIPTAYGFVWHYEIAKRLEVSNGTL